MSTARRHALLQATDFERAKAAILAALHRAGLDGAVQFQTDQRGLTVRVITDRVLFDADLATLAPDGRQVIEAIAPALRSLPNEIQVEGHTNNVAVKPKFFPTEWELSSARAVTVVRFLIDRFGVEAKRLGAIGYADQRPLLPPSDPRSVSANRRVDIVVQSTLTPAEQGMLSAYGVGKLLGGPSKS
jgi:chemotaxis protein MotB